MTGFGRAMPRALCCAAGLVASSALRAQAGSCGPVRDSARAWAAPLDRPVTLHSSGASLRTALDLLAARAGVRLSYSSDLLPLDREACVPGGPMPLGAALTLLLRDLPVQPTPSGGAQVVLAPVRLAPVLAPRVASLDRVVVTGSAAGAAQRRLPYAVDVVDGRDLRGPAAPTVAQVLNGAIPGVWLWNDAPTALLSRFGSLRGASSFGVSAPKVFVDGIELANPLLLTRLTADAVDRIEVIRGPQGAALYGADAISGVINVQLRHDGAAGGGRDIALRSTAGAIQSDYTNTGALMQEHVASVRMGSAERSAHVIAALNTTGAVVPGSSATHLSVDAGARRVLARTIVAGTARAWIAEAEPSRNPLLASLQSSVAPGTAIQPATSQRVSQYTVGGTLTHAPDAAWTHTVTAGVDGYRLRGVSIDAVPVPSALDSVLLASSGGADKATVRLTSVRRVSTEDGLTATTTIGADGALLRDATTSAAPTQQSSGPLPPPIVVPLSAADTRWLSTIGFGVQSSLGIRDRVFFTGGVRAERNGGFSDASRLVTLPSLGVTAIHTVAALTLKARVAYGAGVRPARNPMREAVWRGTGGGAIRSDLQPERQDGVEAGLDLFWGPGLSLHATRFDQQASSLIQQVPVPLGSGRGSDGGGRPARYASALTNLGAISNRGWEFALQQRYRSVSVAGTLSLVNSRVTRTAASYSGDLRNGDRMLNVPARTLGLTGTWAPQGWTVQLAASSATDWIGYDRLALARTFLNGGAPSRELTGATLRTYWLPYGDVTRVRAAVTRDLTRLLALRLIGDNLLDRQRGEPDNLTIVPGRSLSVGLAGRF
jgi:iron complex outermembrane recepter protein